MAIFEPIFDVTYLCLVLALGIRLLPVPKKEAKLFGIMSILLGLGDAFHLMPRIISHFSPDGFAAHYAALSWGKMITGITMTIFYVLYYSYYQAQSEDTNKTKQYLIWGLAALRMILIALPQNQWGTQNENYLFAIYRNIPFAIMGILLILWSYQHRDKKGLRYMSLLILLSFAFYLPVVLWSDTYPIIGALMMPKTLAYLLIVIFGFRYFIPEKKPIHLLELSFAFLIMGLISGVFYREFTKFYGFAADSHLSKLHVHTLVLGFLLYLMLYLVLKRYDESTFHSFKKPLFVYFSGLVFTLCVMTVFGIYDVVSMGEKTIKIAALEGLSGLGHICLSVGIVWLMLKILRIEQKIKR